ncbi:hypothetical protein GOP47_0005914 [Adiantum capillus-veneris]|uniref:Uncharacterized protein n=1 Tax=Adiantum capillus-veneris TaxID=13818 RepID=A0A9D4V2U4_ADICA|nr:hypothetical protein GOP47_0005914 [Adiantum capillus-veneris]
MFLKDQKYDGFGLRTKGELNDYVLCQHTAHWSHHLSVGPAEDTKVFYQSKRAFTSPCDSFDWRIFWDLYGNDVHKSVQYGYLSIFSSNTIQIPAPDAHRPRCEPPVVIYRNYSPGAELLPSRIVVPETDFYMRRLWGKPEEDLPITPRYLLTFTVGFDQREIINAAISKFSKNWTVVLFHYDGRASEWAHYEWAQNVIHISARKQSKWWFAKRFLHPDVVAPYEYIFLWDEDLGLDSFDAEMYIELVRKHGLEISQPALEPSKKLTWRMTMRRFNSEVHRETSESFGRCKDPHKPPCTGFVEIMAPVFSKSAWKCVWHLIQNDLIHGWGLDFELGRCVKPAFEKVGVVDAQWIVHKFVPSLGSQGESVNGRAPWEGVRDRCHYEWDVFQKRLAAADEAAMRDKTATFSVG